ncbi:amino acid permease/ SLC12A domain-containing protein [Cokeromyces recurvatus]|uniref:amino acid permease/ SLC12A domain-containing protein n=1 Tax=Cokeromyces recurvatus TaxID=90255 RepID=UPI00221EE088|nr:amino acid permease/ SLC12A domain-containing protein [Cokeromyces recurvatus]KAI7906616.1 amino acid permease/ SLC12A domain-containing protein [Cokeromyces recurvatus]
MIDKITSNGNTSSYESQKIEEFEKAPSYFSNSHVDQEDLENNNHIQDGTVRGLSARHIQMISLGGAIGTGLFLSSGSNVAEAGPAGALIAYCVVGFMVYCIMTCLGEMATFMPVSGSFNHYATRFVEPSLGFALGWNYWFSAVTIATELAAAATIIKFWKEVLPDAAWSTIFLVLTVAVNFLGVRIYGELEYWFAMIKIVIVIVFIIIGILVATGAVGGHTIGFEYWKNPGAFNNGVVGTISVLLAAGFSFQGTEIVGITAGEAKNPTKTVPRAIRNTFWRIIIFYVCTIFLIGLCIPHNNENLLNADGGPGTASFTLVFQLAGIEAGSHVINAIVLTSVLSALNSSMYTTSRTLMGLARDNNAPAFLGRVNKYGAPFWAVCFSSLVGFACVFASIYSAEQAFVWFLSITAVSGFISWAGIAAVHIRFRRAYIRQGRSIEDLPYKAFAYPFSGLFATILCILIILGQGYSAFSPQFDSISFVTSYIGIVPFFLCYIIHKLVTRKKLIPLEEVDFETGRVTRYDIEKDNEQDKTIPRWKRIIAWII